MASTLEHRASVAHAMQEYLFAFCFANLFDKASYDSAISLYKEAVGLKEHRLGKISLEVAKTLINCGQTLLQHSKIDEAKEMYLRYRYL